MGTAGCGPDDHQWGRVPRDNFRRQLEAESTRGVGVAVNEDGNRSLAGPGAARPDHFKTESPVVIDCDRLDEPDVSPRGRLPGSLDHDARDHDRLGIGRGGCRQKQHIGKDQGDCGVHRQNSLEPR